MMEDEPDFRWQFVVNYPEDISAEGGDSGFMKNFEGESTGYFGILWILLV